MCLVKKMSQPRKNTYSSAAFILLNKDVLAEFILMPYPLLLSKSKKRLTREDYGRNETNENSFTSIAIFLINCAYKMLDNITKCE